MESEQSSVAGIRKWSPLFIAIGHLFVAYLASTLIETPTTTTSLTGPSAFSSSKFWDLFFMEWFVIGTFLYALVLALSFVGLNVPRTAGVALAAAALSAGVAVLLAGDAVSSPAAPLDPDTSLWALIYVLITQHQAILALSFLFMVFTLLVLYRLARAMLTVEYEGAGVQIRLPGHLVYYIPVFPQVSWQKTGIRLRKGETVTVELYGWVSPGALQETSSLKRDMDKFVEWQRQGGNPEEWEEDFEAVMWPWTDPRGYAEEDYGPTNKLPVLRKHPTYQKDYYFREDPLLTVQGQPHNRVFGIIQAGGEEPPLSAAIQRPAYNWANPEDKDKLLLLSSDNYPKQLDIAKSGQLWVVINDVDIARWDNGGLYFLKLTRNVGPLSREG